VRRRHEAELLEVGHDVTDGRRAQVEAGIARQRAGADRLAIADVLLDQYFEQLLGAIAQVVFSRFNSHLGQVTGGDNPILADERGDTQVLEGNRMPRGAGR